MIKFPHKSKIYPIVLIIIVIIVYYYRKSQNRLIVINGKTMGTYYSIKYVCTDVKNFKEEIDSILVDFSNALSTYIPDSEISQFNTYYENNKNPQFETRNQKSVPNTLYEFRFSSPYFYPVLQKSKEVYLATNGAFDPTVMPLVNSWGFGFTKANMPDSNAVDSLLQFVCFDSIYFDSVSIRKHKPGIMLDFSAIAKGYGVDVIAAYLSSRNINNYMVEIGGEVVCMGENKRGETWTIGINNPKYNYPPLNSSLPGTRDGEASNPVKLIITTVKLKNKALATSGNYRNYYIKNGRKYAHTIDPKTGYPVEHNLLSISVFADDCITADAFATAFMVLGKDKAIEILKKRANLEAYFIFENDKGKIKTYLTEGLEGVVEL